MLDFTNYDQKLGQGSGIGIKPGLLWKVVSKRTLLNQQSSKRERERERDGWQQCR